MMVAAGRTLTAGIVFGLGWNSLCASANDTTASFALGGLVPLKQTAIAMETENLSITPGQVQVEYLFNNKSDNDIDTTVEFPLPKFNHRFFFLENSPWSNNKSGNLVDFSVTVNGAQVHPASLTRAYIGNEDVTDRLTALGVPLGSGIEPKYSPELDDALVRAHLMEQLDMRPLANIPLWDEQTTFYWRQRFPAASRLQVKHRYSPAAGEEHFNGGSDYRSDNYDDLDRICLGDRDKAEFVRLATIDKEKNPKNNGYIAELITIDYILTTANNWRGPIGDFSLRITADRPHTMVASCFPGLVRTDENNLTLHSQNYSPKSDLRVYYVELNQAP